MADPGIQTYKDLRVWNLAMDLVEDCYRLSAKFPREEIYGLTAQLRRSAISIPAIIAEGFGWESRATYINFLRIAQGSLKELETHILLSLRIGLGDPEFANLVLNKCDDVGRMLRGLIRSLDGHLKF